MTIYTIGYEGIDIDDFLYLLQKNNIETVVDIRELPLSRKQGFSKNSLSNHLNLQGFEYIHLPKFGCPKPIRNQYKSDSNWQTYKQAFTKYIKTQSKELLELANLANSSNCALFCFEADYNFCHRSLVANEIHKNHGLSIDHVKVIKSKTKNFADSKLAFA
jgi:uncharacterized protein (DUF488 family)